MTHSKSGSTKSPPLPTKTATPTATTTNPASAHL